MCVWVIVPVKPLKLAKSRLAQVLTPDERQQVAGAMFRHVLEVVSEVPQVAGTLVISRDNKALSIAREYGANTVQESGTPELNLALERATQVLSSWRCDSVLVLPADLPLICPDDITSIVEMGRDDPSMVIAADRSEDGTNALFLRPPGLIPYSFGPGSYRRHIDLALAEGIKVKEYHTPRVSLDIDFPEDIERYYRLVRLEDLHPIEMFLPEGTVEQDRIFE
jgi:2-phospho-L-lactate guanylyltransferase